MFFKIIHSENHEKWTKKREIELSEFGGGEQKGKNSKGKVDKRDLLHNNFMLEKQV